MVIKKFNGSKLAQKFMQVGVDVTYMHTNFGERDLSGFGDIATFKNGKFPFPNMDYSPCMVIKIMVLTSSHFKGIPFSRNPPDCAH